MYVEYIILSVFQIEQKFSMSVWFDFQIRPIL